MACSMKLPRPTTATTPPCTMRTCVGCATTECSHRTNGFRSKCSSLSDGRSPTSPPGSRVAKADAGMSHAFCCAWLLRTAGEVDESLVAGENETVIQLLDSLEHLGPGPWREASGLLDWYRPLWSRKGGSGEDALLGVAQLHCALRAGFPDDARLVALCEWIVARKAAIGSSWQFDERWGLRGNHGNMKAAKWQALGARLAGLDLSDRAPELSDWVKLIGESLAK